MEKLNESVKVFKGTFVDGKTFLDPSGNPYDLIPSVLDEPEISQEDQDKINDLSSGGSPSGNDFNWEGKTNKRKGKVVLDVQEPDPTMSYIDDETNKVYKWDKDKQVFVEIAGGDDK